MDRITAAPISTFTDIDCSRCGLIEVHLATERNEHGRADIDYHRYRLRPMWINRGSFGIPSLILPFRAGTPLRAFCDSLRYATGGAKGSSFRALPPLLAVGGRLSALPHIICRLPLTHPHTICRSGQALHSEPFATPSATLREAQKALRFVPSLHS